VKKLDVEESPRKTPRPSGEDIPELYRKLDEMTRRVEILTALISTTPVLKRWMLGRLPRKASWS
jgi:hypothetical protein